MTWKIVSKIVCGLHRHCHTINFYGITWFCFRKSHVYVLVWCWFGSRCATLYRFVDVDFIWFGWNVRFFFFSSTLFSFGWFTFGLYLFCLLSDQLWLAVYVFVFRLALCALHIWQKRNLLTNGIGSLWLYRFCRVRERLIAKLTLEFHRTFNYCFSKHLIAAVVAKCSLDFHIYNPWSWPLNYFLKSAKVVLLLQNQSMQLIQLICCAWWFLYFTNKHTCCAIIAWIHLWVAVVLCSFVYVFVKTNDKTFLLHFFILFALHWTFCSFHFFFIVSDIDWW